MLRAQIPVLETPRGAIYESNAICRYIAGQSGKGLYPTAVHGGADIRGAIDGWIDWTAELDSRLNDAGAPLWRGLPAGTDEKEAKKVLGRLLAAKCRNAGLALSGLGR